IDAATGIQKWLFNMGRWIYCDPVVADGVVYIGCDDHTLYALDATTGAEKWRFEAADEIRSSPVVVDGILYFADMGGYVYALH
ncbi:MAG: PQQ-binding-like beta-propeller repeat protein, partial [Deltaproteobacteria bacterium]|nr:PQQ-binding-like beta-propeller repeat protein [Candidatus Zymogenaceae bacterium]